MGAPRPTGPQSPSVSPRGSVSPCPHRARPAGGRHPPHPSGPRHAGGSSHRHPGALGHSQPAGAAWGPGRLRVKNKARNLGPRLMSADPVSVPPDSIETIPGQVVKSHCPQPLPASNPPATISDPPLAQQVSPGTLLLVPARGQLCELWPLTVGQPQGVEGGTPTAPKPMGRRPRKRRPGDPSWPRAVVLG